MAYSARATRSPEPMAEFIDAFIVGDGEEVIHAVVDHVKRAKHESLPRPALLRRLAHVPGVYVPSGYDLESTPEGWQVPIARPGFPPRPCRRRKSSPTTCSWRAPGSGR